jgi:hypothetical protein
MESVLVNPLCRWVEGKTNTNKEVPGAWPAAGVAGLKSALASPRGKQKT